MCKVVRQQIEGDQMSEKLYLIISGVIFLLVGIFHLLRLVYHWPIVVGTRVIPHSLSYVGFPVSIGYSVWAAWLLRGK
jgi:hypothetical protein